MRIRQIGAAGLAPVPHSPLDGGQVGGGVPAAWSPWPISILSVETDVGLTGIGSVYSDVRLVRATLAVLEPLYRGEVAFEPGRLSAKLRANASWMGRGGAIDHTISGIDIALWDLLGQMTGQPVGRLLGGRYREVVRPYASIIAGDVGLLRERLQKLAADGFRAFKIGWGAIGRTNEAVDESIVKSARAAVGDEAELMVDAGGSGAFWPHGYNWAVRMADLAAAYGVAWLEEPLRPDSLEDYSRLRARSSTPIACGEALVGRQSFRPFIETGAVDVVQPDVSKVGGLSEQRRIAESAEDHGLRYVGHGSYTAVGVAADLQLASALPGATLVEFEVDSPYLEQICNEAFRLDADGMLPIPERPGLGVTLDPGALERVVGDPT